MRHLRKSAGELDKVKTDVGISRTVGGSAAILGGLAVLATPFTAGVSLLTAGLIVGIGGGVTAAGASVADGLIEQKIGKESEWAFAILKELHGLSFVLEVLHEMNSKIVSAVKHDKKGLIASLIGLELEALLIGGKITVQLGSCVYEVTQLVLLASIVRPELAEELGQLIVQRAWAPDVALPGKVLGLCLTRDGTPRVLSAAGEVPSYFGRLGPQWVSALESGI